MSHAVVVAIEAVLLVVNETWTKPKWGRTLPVFETMIRQFLNVSFSEVLPAF